MAVIPVKIEEMCVCDILEYKNDHPMSCMSCHKRTEFCIHHPVRTQTVLMVQSYPACETCYRNVEKILCAIIGIGIPDRENQYYIIYARVPYYLKYFTRGDHGYQFVFKPADGVVPAYYSLKMMADRFIRLNDKFSLHGMPRDFVTDLEEYTKSAGIVFSDFFTY